MSKEEKANILDAWILEEHLSEGNIDLKDKELIDLSELRKATELYTILKDRLNKIKSNKKEKKGVVIYTGIKSAQEIIQTVRDVFHLEPDEEDQITGDKFQIALYFDENLSLLEDNLFITACACISRMKSDLFNNRYIGIPKLEVFKAYENDYKTELMSAWVDFFDNDSDSYNVKEQFWQSIFRIISKCPSGKVRLKIVKNIETDATNLHSFFVKDLERAKNLSNQKLNDYLFGTDEHQDLNTDENKDIFHRILQPSNYPLGRFPSNKIYALSLMQQVAVNLAIGYDNRQIRSVNGPPGTGKTTLLKDIFAELLVKQAYEIVNRQSNLETVQYNNNGETYKISKVPECIADKGIVVASSNHAAVQNIVNELPLKEKIEDPDLLEKILAADYFTDISNNKSEWKDGEVTDTPLPGAPRWGLFSLEGGKRENINDMLCYLQKMVLYFENDYKELYLDAYAQFKRKYDEVQSYRDGISNYIEKIYKYKEILKKIEKTKDALAENLHKYEITEKKVEALSIRKRWYYFIPWLKSSKDYYNEKKQYSKQLNELLNERSNYEEEINEGEKQQNDLIRGIQRDIESIKPKEKDSIDIDYNLKADALHDEINELLGIKELDMNESYERLQKDNPWFSVRYRELQSELFIEALRVRKQFLYENKNNLKFARVIWLFQDSISNQEAIKEAWNWINLAIPIIGTTFASFRRMFDHIGENGIGYLFVDEAGQAVPQACVGGIFRSRNIMVVGDPAQIRPVVTLDEGVLSLIRKSYNVSEKYISENTSVQMLVDQASTYGYYRTKEKTNWIGIPLWVHRRCKSPMFDISNVISYDGKMVQGASKKPGKAAWYDVSGTAVDKYVEEQGEKLKELLLGIQNEEPDAFKKDNYIYIITPFRNVERRLAEKLNEIGFTKYVRGRSINIGTVHKFQGKEANIVFLVLGADNSRIGAAEWAMGPRNPNIMNVAATRAKEEFYIIGDKELYMNLHSFVIDKTLSIIGRYEKNGVLGREYS